MYCTGEEAGYNIYIYICESEKRVKGVSKIKTPS